MSQIGILGGTFDPIHLGHLIPAEYACGHLGLDKVLLVPSAAPVHRPRHSPAGPAHRLRMCELAAASLPPFGVSDVEVSRAEPSYTVLTLRWLANSLGPDVGLVLLVGEDNLPLLHSWHEIRQIVRLAKLAILPRPVSAKADLGPLEAVIGARAVRDIVSRRVPGPLVPISATQIRDRVGRGEPITGLVPASVAAYIAANDLYKAG